MNLTLSNEEIHALMVESIAFRNIILSKLNNLEDDSEIKLVEDLKENIRNNYTRQDGYIDAIKYVRRWAVDNKNMLSAKTYNELSGLACAKKFVDAILPRISDDGCTFDKF